MNKRRKKVALSGGRTSAKMLRVLMDEYGSKFDSEFIVTFCNTGKEFNQTLDFVHEIEQRWGVEVIWLEYTRVPAHEIDPSVYPHPKSQKTIIEQQRNGLTTHWFKIVNYDTARRNGKPNSPFDELLGWANVLPNVRTRICSVQMKVRTMMRYLFSIGIYQWEDYIGMRYDEAHRGTEVLANCPKYITPVFPLIDSRTTESDVLAFWKAQPFDLNLQSYQGNCDLCFLKARHKMLRLVSEMPHLNDWWESWESKFSEKPQIEGDGKYFRKGQPYSGLRREFEMERKQQSLFPDDDIPCGCGDKGLVLAASSEGEMEI